jgi:hypothetical protein
MFAESIFVFSNYKMNFILLKIFLTKINAYIFCNAANLFLLFLSDHRVLTLFLFVIVAWYIDIKKF